MRALLEKPPDQPALERFQAAGYRLAILTKTDGVVSWRYVDVDYRTRSEPEDIIAALTVLSA